MSLQGIILINILGAGLIFLLFNLVRTKKLYVGYAIVWITAVLVLMVLVSVPPLLYLLPGLVGAVYPASALSLLAFVFIFLVLILMSVKLSTLTTRQAEMIQAMALLELRQREARSKDDAVQVAPQDEMPRPGATGKLAPRPAAGVDKLG